MSTIPYTHWAYFPDLASANTCAVDLNELGCLVRVDPSQGEPSEWVLHASRDIAIPELPARHAEAQAVVERHRGVYDGGESGWMDARTARFLHPNALDMHLSEIDPELDL